MIQIDDVVVSLDVLREKFLCDLDACKGECCIEVVNILLNSIPPTARNTNVTIIVFLLNCFCFIRSPPYNF